MGMLEEQATRPLETERFCPAFAGHRTPGARHLQLQHQLHHPLPQVVLCTARDEQIAHGRNSGLSMRVVCSLTPSLKPKS